VALLADTQFDVAFDQDVKIPGLITLVENRVAGLVDGPFRLSHNGLDEFVVHSRKKIGLFKIHGAPPWPGAEGKYPVASWAAGPLVIVIPVASLEESQPLEGLPKWLVRLIRWFLRLSVGSVGETVGEVRSAGSSVMVQPAGRLSLILPLLIGLAVGIH
jgi:hypothetical protein